MLLSRAKVVTCKVRAGATKAKGTDRNGIKANQAMPAAPSRRGAQMCCTNVNWWRKNPFLVADPVSLVLQAIVRGQRCARSGTRDQAKCFSRQPRSRRQAHSEQRISIRWIQHQLQRHLKRLHCCIAACAKSALSLQLSSIALPSLHSRRRCATPTPAAFAASAPAQLAAVQSRRVRHALKLPTTLRLLPQRLRQKRLHLHRPRSSSSRS